MRFSIPNFLNPIYTHILYIGIRSITQYLATSLFKYKIISGKKFIDAK